MLNGYVIASLLIAISLVILGAAAYSRNPKSQLHRYFFVFCSSLAVWLVSNYIAGNIEFPNSTALVANRLVFIFGGASILALVLFTKRMTKSNLRRWERNTLYACMIAIIFSATPLVVKKIFVDNDTYAIEFGPLSLLYFLALPTIVVIALTSLIRSRKKIDAVTRSQVDVILLSFAVGLGAILITNAFLPFMFNYFGLAQIGSFFSILFVMGLLYSIIQHRLFDLRLIVARTLAYGFLTFTLLLIYCAIILIPSVYLIPDERSTLKNSIPFIAALFVAGSSPFLKKFFDKLTNRFFYRDAYEPQVFLDQLNKALVGEIEMQKLLTTVTKIMEANLKSSYVAVGVKETENRPLRVMGENAPKYKAEEIMYVRNELQHSGKRIVIATDLATEKHKLQEIFRKNDIDIIVRLLTSYDTGQEAIAYLILGPKKSGNIYNKQDIQILGIIADELVIAIQNALRFEEIQEFAVTLQQKVDEATARLRRTNEKLKELDDTKDEFISMASHQLRTPLTSVKGYLSMVLEGDAGAIKPQQKQLLEQSFLSAQRMVYIIADLLNVSRLKTGKFVLDVNPTDITEMIKGEIDQLKEAFRAKKLTVEFDKPKEFPMLLLDETKTRQVIMNFIDNAIYYTPAGGRIDVSLTQDKKHTYFRVKDSGLGVPKSEQAHLFTKFYRATNARKARPDGTGLGLFMAKKVIVAQGGTILFESQEGKGSTFGFCFETAKLIPASTEKPQEAAKV